MENEPKPIKILTIGTWDVPHLGHYNFLRQIKCLFPESELFVGVNFDHFIKKFKGKNPIFDYKERSNLIDLIDFVDKVLPNIGNEDSKKLIRLVKPDVLAIGSDWASKDYYKQMKFTQKWLDKHKISLIYIPYTEVISTTIIKERIKK